MTISERINKLRQIEFELDWARAPSSWSRDNRWRYKFDRLRQARRNRLLWANGDK